MERCPNCGAPARLGAKFCTTCGHRIANGEAVESVAAADAADGGIGAADEAAGSTWSPGGTSTVAAEPEPDVELLPVAPAAEHPAEVAIAPDSAEPAAVEADAADHVLSSSWPTPAPSPWSASWPGAGTADEPGTAPPASESEAAPPNGKAPVPSGWPPDGLGSDGPIAGADQFTATEAPAFSGEAPLTEEVQASAEEPAPGAAAVAAGPASSLFVATPEARPVSGSAETVPPLAAEADPVARAVALLDELRSLLPGLAPVGPALPPIADALEQALPARDTSLDRFADLRAAMQHARDHPRDIDTVLELSRRVDNVIALIDDYDRLVAAAERTIATLRA